MDASQNDISMAHFSSSSIHSTPRTVTNAPITAGLS